MIRRLLNWMRKPEPMNSLEPVRPRVAPDPAWTAELERRRAAVDYRPEHPFHSSTFVRKAQ